MAWYGESKVYNDGSHYIAIPHTTRLVKKRPKPLEELITVEENNDVEGSENIVSEPSHPVIEFEEVDGELVFEENEQIVEERSKKTSKKSKRITKKEYFNELYSKYFSLKKNERKKIIIKEMLPHFDNERQCKDFVERNFERKLRNLICRRTRMARKANLANFNYFCTFTYDSKLHDEESFRKKIKITFQNLASRKGWKYMGVWERGRESNRLHFHGLFFIPNGTMPGEIITVRDYNTRNHRMQDCYQCTYFNNRFGRSDFEEIDGYEKTLGSALSYMMKYIDKTGEKIVYSKNLPQYFISDILEEDIICRIGQEDKKLLLHDDFHCLDEGVLIGRVSPEVISQMRTAN